MTQSDVKTRIFGMYFWNVGQKDKNVHISDDYILHVVKIEIVLDRAQYEALHSSTVWEYSHIVFTGRGGWGSENMTIRKSILRYQVMI